MSSIDLPSPASFTEASGLADALADALRPAPLSGPAKSATKDVQEWRVAVGASEDDGLLDRYNAAAAFEPDQLALQLAEIAKDPLGREAAISLVAHAGTSVPVRRLALKALEGAIGPADVGLLVRVSLRQRPQVLEVALPLIASTGQAEALFALRKVFALRKDETATRAEQLAAEVAESVPEAVSLADHLEDSDAVSAMPSASRSTLFVVLSLDSSQQRMLSGADASAVLVAQLEPLVRELDSELRERSRFPSGLNPYEVRLRDELLEFVLVSGLDVGDELWRRATDNLFRREDTDDVERLLPHLTPEALRDYAERSLARDHRRGKREDRALASLRALAQARSPIQRDFRPAALEVLDETSEPLRFEAARFLATQLDELDPADRARLTETYESLSSGARRRLAGELGPSVAGKARTIEAFLSWVTAENDEALTERVDALLQRWATEPNASADDAAAYLDAFAGLFSRLPDDERERAETQLVVAASTWLRARRGVIREPVRTLLRWVRLREIAVSRFSSFADRLKADQARGLLDEAIREDDGVSAQLLARAATVQLSDDYEERLLMPVLADRIAADPRAARAVADEATGRSAARLLAAGLIAGASVVSELDRRRRALELGTTETLERHKSEVLRAVDEAVLASEGNERLGNLLAAIRRALSGEERPEPRDPSRADELPAAVLRYHDDLRARYPDVLEGPGDQGQVLTLTDDFLDNGEQVAEVISQLDRRAHSKRVAPPADRPHYRRDLEEILQQVVAAGGLWVDDQSGSIMADARLGAGGTRLQELLDRPESELRAVLFDLDVGHAEDVDAGLAAAVRYAGTADDLTQAAERLSRALAATPPTRITVSTQRLEATPPARVWRVLEPLIETTNRDIGRLRAETRERERQIGTELGRELDLPFKLIEDLMFSYFRLRSSLSEAGWKQIARKGLGEIVTRDRLDPELHEVRGSADADRFILRTLGIKFDGQVVSRAVAEGLIGPDVTADEDGEDGDDR